MSTEGFRLSTTTGDLHCPRSHGFLYYYSAWLLHSLVTHTWQSTCDKVARVPTPKITFSHY